ncbi:MAG: hypothetical protein LAP85_29205 [Acidobacteriia bacterium]|nr:hypothetical protein [Terriglobia bacterium]
MTANKQIPGGYLAFPHRIIKRANQLKLSGSQRRALDCSVYQQIGNEKNYLKGSFQGGLAMFAKHGNMTKAEASRAVDVLINTGLLIKIRPENGRQPAEYKLNLDGCENATVVNLQPSDKAKPGSRLRKSNHNGCENATVVNLQPSDKAKPGSRLRKSNHNGCENATVRLQKHNLDGCENATLYNHSYNITGSKHLPSDNNPPSPLVKGEQQLQKTQLLPPPVQSVSEKQKEKAASQREDPRLENLKFMFEIFHDVFRQRVSVADFAKGQQAQVEGIFERKQGRQLTAMLNDFASCCSAVRSNGGLPPGKTPAEAFLYLLRSRKEIGRNGSRQSV